MPKGKPLTEEHKRKISRALANAKPNKIQTSVKENFSKVLDGSAFLPSKNSLLDANIKIKPPMSFSAYSKGQEIKQKNTVKRIKGNITTDGKGNTIATNPNLIQREKDLKLFNKAKNNLANRIESNSREIQRDNDYTYRTNRPEYLRRIKK